MQTISSAERLRCATKSSSCCRHDCAAKSIETWVTYDLGLFVAFAITTQHFPPIFFPPLGNVEVR